MTTGRFFALLVASGLLLIGWAYWTAIADPVVREAAVALPGWPEGAPPLRLGAVPDLWLVTLGPRPAAAPSPR